MPSVSIIILFVSMFYTFFFADVVTCTDFKKVSNSRERLTVSVFIPNSVCSLFFQGRYLSTFISLRLVGCLRVVDGGADLPAELRDLLYHPFFVFIGSWCITAPFASYNM